MTLTPHLLVAMAGGKPRLRQGLVRDRKAPRIAPRESTLHADVADLLNTHCLPDWRFTHINRKCKDAREGAIMKRLGVKPGWFDFILISPARLPHFLDVKRIGENLSDPQEEFRAWCFTWNIPNAVAWTMDEVLTVFDTWGCLRIKYNKRAG